VKSAIGAPEFLQRLPIRLPALVAGIHALTGCETKDVDGRDKPGHDAREAFANLYLRIFASSGLMSPD
jgi:hypothetical protein